MTGRRWLGASGVVLLILVAACAGGVAPTPPATLTAPVATDAVAATPSVAPSPTPSPSPSARPTAEPLPSGLDPEVVAAIAWRRSMGLLTVLDWAFAVMADPAAVNSWTYPILREEEDWM